MNEIEQAIEYLAPITEHPTMTGEYCKNLKVAVKALREKAEREKGCEYCNSRFGIASHHVNQAGMQAGTNRNAKCCPECGRRLEVEHDGR
jgi:uncharacterized Zn-finger protein